MRKVKKIFAILLCVALLMSSDSGLYSSVWAGSIENEEQKTYVYEQNDAQTHLVTYPCCNTSTEVAHRGTWVDLDTTYHQRTCTDCGYVQLQTHAECWNSLKGMCMACKRKGPISGGSILVMPPREEMLE